MFNYFDDPAYADAVIGAGRGIGRAAALEMAGQGIAVACLDRDGAAAEETAREIGKGGRRSTARAMDVTDAASAYRDLEDRLGPRVIVMPMAGKGVELSLGLTRDPQFGPILMLGAGGTLIELLKDRRFVLPPFDEGEALFDGDQASEATKAILQFCEQFEAAGQRTAAFMEDLTKGDLLMDGEVAIQPEGFQQPFVYRGFRMVDEEKLRNLRGDELRKMNQNGMLPLMYAHLFSLSEMRSIFAKQLAQGKAPAQVPEMAPANV